MTASKLYPASVIKEIDRQYSQDYDISSFQLMKLAARRVVEGELLLVDGRRDVADRVRAVLDERFLRAVQIALDVVARPGPDPELVL